jgi:hypothetical protein
MGAGRGRTIDGDRMTEQIEGPKPHGETEPRPPKTTSGPTPDNHQTVRRKKVKPDTGRPRARPVCYGSNW